MARRAHPNSPILPAFAAASIALLFQKLAKIYFCAYSVYFRAPRRLKQIMPYCGLTLEQLQYSMERSLGLSPEQTRKSLAKLYRKGLASYPYTSGDCMPSFFLDEFIESMLNAERLGLLPPEPVPEAGPICAPPGAFPHAHACLAPGRTFASAPDCPQQKEILIAIARACAASSEWRSFCERRELALCACAPDKTEPRRQADSI